MLSPRQAAALLAGLVSIGAIQAQPVVRYFTPSFTSTTTQNIVYGSNINPWTTSSQSLQLDMYEPTGDTETARPVYVHVHGGQYYRGDKADPFPQSICQGFATLGYVAVSINYRLSPSANNGGLGPDVCAEDAKAAIRFLRRSAATYRLDTTRIAIGGDAEGGSAAYIVANTTWPGTSGSPGYDSTPSACVGLWAFATQPYLNRNVPLALVHGTADPVLPYAWSQALASSASAAGVQALLIPVLGGANQPLLASFSGPLWGTLYEFLSLGRLSGLVLKNEYALNGKMTFSTTGFQGIVGALFISPDALNTYVPPLGQVIVNPLTWQFLYFGVHAPGVYADIQSVTFQLPPGIKGGFYAQVFEISTVTWYYHRVTNGFFIPFP